MSKLAQNGRTRVLVDAFFFERSARQMSAIRKGGELNWTLKLKL